MFNAEAQRLKVRVEVRDIRQTATDIRLATVDSRLSQISPASDVGQVFQTALESDVYENAPQPTRVVSPETSVLEAECRATCLVFWSPDTPHLYDVVVSLVGED